MFRSGVKLDWRRWTRSGAGALVLFSFGRAAHAQDDLLGSIETHGFVSQGFILTLDNDYLAQGTTDGSFEFSEVGINFTKPLSDNLRTGVQFFAGDLGPTGGYTAKVDWFYLDYRFFDQLGLRAGRLKIPYGLYNEIQDADAARVPVVLPQSVYPLQARQFLFAQTGVELYGFARLEPLGAFDYRAFAGTIFLDAEELTPPGTPFELEFHVPFVAGGRLIWETPVEGLNVGGSLQAVRLDTTAFIPGIEPVVLDTHSTIGVGFAEYRIADLVLTAEYSRWWGRQGSSNTMVQGELREAAERAYGMASYRVTPWFQPAAYYSVFFPNVDNRSGRQNYQHDVAGTLRFDLNDHWLVKVEGHYMSGTAGLLGPLQINPADISIATKDWAAFFLKTTAHF